jgi:hypothetical protein
LRNLLLQKIIVQMSKITAKLYMEKIYPTKENVLKTLNAVN